MRKKEHKWILIVFAAIIFVGVMFMPPKDFRMKDGRLETYEGGEKTVTIPRLVKTIGSKAFDSTVVETLIIPGSVKKIEGGAFAYSKITTFVVKEGVEEIAEDAFRNTKPLDVLLPSTIKTPIDFNQRDGEEKVRIHIVKDSYIDKYLQDNPIKKNYEIKYDYKELIK